MLKNKFFIFIISLLCVFGFLCGSVYATEETGETENTETVENYSFTGFDGISYELPELPEGVNNYTHYVLIHDSKISRFVLYCFNETLEVTRGSWISLVGDSGDTGKVYIYSSPTDVWYEYAEQSYSVDIDSTFIHSCPDLTQYSDELNSSEDFFLNPQTVLPPIAEKIRLGMVLQEIVAILPVILMTIVGLIGLRKALGFLSKVLHRS